MAAKARMTPEERVNRLGNANLIPLIFSMSAPAICGNLSNALYSIVSRAYLGHADKPEAMGAMGLIMPLVSIVAALSVMITIGGAAVVSLALGEQDKREADIAFTNVMTAAVGSSSVMAIVFFFFAEQMVRFCGATPDNAVFGYAVQYLRITCFGYVFQMINHGAASVIRAEGNTLYSMYVSIIGNVFNIAFGALFIVWFKMGIKGAASATLLAQFIGMSISLSYFIRGRSLVKWAGAKTISLRKIGEVLYTGIAPAVFQGLNAVNGMLIGNSLQAVLPGTGVLVDGVTVNYDVAMSAISVISSLENVALMLIMGMNNGIATIISYNYGAKNYKRVMKTSLVGQAMASAAALLVWSMMMLCPQVLFAIFIKKSTSAAVLTYGAWAIKRSKMFMFFVGFQTLASMYYSAIRKPRWAMAISIIRNGLFLVPALLILPRLWGLDGLLYSTSVSDACSVVLVSVLYTLAMLDLRRKTREQDGLLLNEKKYAFRSV